MLKKSAIEYFNFFSNKNIKEVGEMLSENVTLNDWSISCSGKSEVINATQNIFDSVDTIDVKAINIYCDKNIVIAELEIVVNGSVVESVADIITFDVSNKIVNIRAYKR